jgi:hypothetical protein
MPINIDISGKIRFNGQDYDGLDAMPADVRQKFEQILAGLKSPDGNRIVIHTSSKVVFNGQEYASVEAMPEDVRRLYQQVMSTIDRDGNGIPDVLEGGSAAASLPARDGNTFGPSAPLISIQPLPEAQNASSQRNFLVIAISLIVLFVLLAGVAAAYFILRGFGG